MTQITENVGRNPAPEQLMLIEDHGLSVLDNVLNPILENPRIKIFAYNSGIIDPGSLEEGLHIVRLEGGYSYLIKRTDGPYSKIDGKQSLGDIFEAAGAEIYRKQFFENSSLGYDEVEKLSSDFDINKANEWFRFCTELGDFRRNRTETVPFNFPKESGVSISQKDFRFLWNWNFEGRNLRTEDVLTK